MTLRSLLLVILLLSLAACTGAPEQSVFEGVDLSDPNVGGGIGFVEDEAENPTPATPDASPRLEVTPQIASPPPGQSSPALPTPTQPEPEPEPTSEPPEPEETTVPVAGEAPPTETETTEPEGENAASELEPEETAAVDDPQPAASEATEEETAEPPAAEETAVNDERPATHVVGPGENLYRIGLQYGVSWLALAQLNGLTNADEIAVGQELLIPPAEGEAEATEEAVAAEEENDSAAAAEDEEPQPAAEEASAPETAEVPAPTPTISPESPTRSPQTETTHTVQRGDTLFRISQAYGVNWVLIAEANGLASPNQIVAGQVLKIPVIVPGPTPEFTHQVRRGETLFRIALQYGLPLADFAEANGLQAPYVIYPGQTLAIPTASAE